MGQVINTNLLNLNKFQSSECLIYYIHQFRKQDHMESVESSSIFKVEDLNQLIKLYAYQIQQRFQQISKVQYGPLSDQQNSDLGQYLIDQYKGYATSNPVQVKYVQKLVQRVIQIFSFFKTRSKHQHLLAIFQEKINTTFQGYLSKRPLNVGDVFTYALQMVKPGFFTKPQSQSYERRRIFFRVPSKESPKMPIVIPKPRKTVSVSNTSHSLAKASTAKSSQTTKITHQQAFTKNYSIMGVDRNYLARTVEHTNNVKREMIQRNEPISKQIKSYANHSKKVKTESDQGRESCVSQVNILSDLNNQNRMYLRKGVNIPSLNNWVNRKRRIATASRARNNQNTWCT